MSKKSPRFRFSGAAVLLTALAFLLPALRDGDPLLYLLTVGVTGVMILALLIFPRMFSLDRFVFTLSLFLGVLPAAALAHISPQAAASQALLCLGGILLLLVGASAGRFFPSAIFTGLAASLVGVLLLSASLASPTLRLNLSEAAVPFLLIGCAALLSFRGGFLSLLPGVLGTVLLFLQSMPLAAVIWTVVFAALLWSSGDRAAWALPVLPVVLFLLLRYVTPVVPEALPAGAAPSDSLSRLLSAGLWGVDAAAIRSVELQGSSLLYPFVSCFGLVFGGLSLLLWPAVSLRGMFVASVARSRFHASLAMGCSLFFTLRTITALLSAFSAFPLPLTDVPFLTSSLPDLFAQYFTLGLVCGISGKNDADLAEDAHLAMLAK